MSAILVICRHCSNIATVIDPAGGPHFAWCDACQVLHHSDPDVETPPAKKPRVKKRKASKPKET